MGTHALALALPFSCVLGLLSSMIATIVGKLLVWIISSYDFIFIYALTFGCSVFK